MSTAFFRFAAMVLVASCSTTSALGARPQQRPPHSIVDLLVWGAQMNVDLRGYPDDVRNVAEVVIARARAYESKRPPPAEQMGLLKMVHQAKVTYERRLVAMARAPGAEAAALAYVTDLAPCYEWEGYSDCPAREAAFARDYQAAHPTSPFSDLLPLLEAHRWLCAAEGFDYEKNPDSATTARTRYRDALRRATTSRDALVRIGAAELEARGSCINPSSGTEVPDLRTREAGMVVVSHWDWIR